jgi:hypothetical protein
MSSSSQPYLNFEAEGFGEENVEINIKKREII